MLESTRNACWIQFEAAIKDLSFIYYAFLTEGKTRYDSRSETEGTQTALPSFVVFAYLVRCEARAHSWCFLRLEGATPLSRRPLPFSSSVSLILVLRQRCWFISSQLGFN